MKKNKYIKRKKRKKITLNISRNTKYKIPPQLIWIIIEIKMFF